MTGTARARSARPASPRTRRRYELLIDGSPATTRIASLGAPAGLRADQLPAVLAALEAKGLVTRSGAHYAAVAPEAALDVLLVTAERELLRARERAGELDQAFQRRRAAGETPPAVVEVVTGQRAPDGTPRSSGPPGTSCAASPSRPTSTRRAAWRPSASCSTGRHEPHDLRAGFVDRIGALRQIETMVGAGQQGRVLPSLPMKLYLMDDRFALLLLRHHPDDPDADAALVVHPSGVLEALSRLFEGLWQRALPLRLRPPAPGAAPPVRARASAHDDERLIRSWWPG